MSRRSRTHPGLVAWAQATSACLTIRRAALRAQHPRASARTIDRMLATELMARRVDRDRYYRRDG